MKNPIRVQYFLWLCILLFGFFLINSVTLLMINLSSILARGPDWRDEFYEWGVITAVGIVVMPVMLISAWQISGRLLAPLRKIIDTSNRIHEGHLTERIETPDARDEIAALSTALNRALDRYEDAVKRQKNFSGAVSHQLRTPLASIRTIGEIALAQERDAESYCNAIGDILEEGNRLSHIIEQLLLMARLNHDDIAATFQPVDIEALLLEIKRQYEPLTQSKGIEVHISTSKGACMQGQYALLHQAGSNLLDNAIRHTPHGGTITMTAKRVNRADFEICICDSGTGFAPQPPDRHPQCDKIVESGSGLGLRIVRDIVQIHNGTISIGTSETGGACVHLLFRQQA